MKKALTACLAALLLCTVVVFAATDGKPYYREPGISPDGNTIAFVYAGDIYLVGPDGGDARLLISNNAYDNHPRFSPDGRWLAFTSGRTGNGDVYIIDLKNGEMRRLTWHNSSDQVSSWSADSNWVYFSSNRADIGGNMDVYKVSIDGGTPVPVSRDRFEDEYNAAVSPDGKTLAFNANDHLNQWWRKGPRIDNETEIWLRGIDVDAMDYRQLTTYVGKDSWPMWAPDGAGLYFATNEGSDTGAENIGYQSLNGERRLVTNFTDGRVLWPDIARNTGDIVFEHEFGIWLLKAGGEAKQLAINAVADNKETPVENQTYTSNVSEFTVSPDGKKMAFVVHGEVFAAPLKPKDDKTPSAFRVTHTPAREINIDWLSDSNRLIYASDRNGQRDIYLYDFIKKEEKRLTDSAENEDYAVVSPDGKYAAYTRGTGEIRMINLEDFSDNSFAKVVLFPDYSWSPDGKWLAYMGVDERYYTNLFAKRADGSGESVQLSYLPHGFGSGPRWSQDGRFIVFNTSHNRLDRMIMRVDLLPLKQEFEEDNFEQLFEMPKSEDKKEEGEKKAEAKDEKKEGEGEKKEEYKIRIVAERIKDRISRLALFAGSPSMIAVTPDNEQFIFTSNPSGTNYMWIASVDPSGSPNTKKLAEGSTGFGNVEFTSDGNSFYYLSGGTIYSMSVKGGNPTRFAVKAEMDIDFNAEKVAAFREAWNVLRDYFFDETFNGLDWNNQYERYAPYIEGTKNYTDFTILGNLWQGDLNASHMGMFYNEGPNGNSIGDLGLDFEPKALLEGRFVVSNVIEESAVARETDAIKPGHELVAINGVETGNTTNINELLENTIGKKVTLRFKVDGDKTEEISVKPVSSGYTNSLRYDAWVRNNAAYVDKISNGRIGYVHIPNMGTDSLLNFRRDLDSEIHGKDGVIVDIRYNNGGWIASFAVDILSRRVTHLQSFRGHGSTPSASLVGNDILGRPSVLLQNEQSLSNAENFSETYRQLGVGKIVGTNTCGWLVFTSGSGLVNGVFIRRPTWKNLTLDGVDMDKESRKPDVFVDRPIGQSLTGKDDQLDASVRVLLEQLDSGDNK